MRSDTRSDDAAWRASIEAWKQKRLVSIGGEDGWITLVGLHWLKEGANRFGSATSNELELHGAPPVAGTITLDNGSLVATIARGVTVNVGGRDVTDASVPILDDRDGREPTTLKLGTLSMFVIKRGDRFGLRVKDREAPARKAWKGLAYYPLQPSLRVRARLNPAPAGETMQVTNVLGQVERMKVPGTLDFTIGGVPYALTPVQEPGDDSLFIIFRDETAGHGTYPSGRFLYAGAPTPDGTVELDFNRAFSPPCAFTAFATCPLPPPSNRLPLNIEAGEKYEGTH